jgi:hypothetical protein
MDSETQEPTMKATTAQILAAAEGDSLTETRTRAAEWTQLTGVAHSIIHYNAAPADSYAALATDKANQRISDGVATFVETIS